MSDYIEQKKNRQMSPQVLSRYSNYQLSDTRRVQSKSEDHLSSPDGNVPQKGFGIWKLSFDLCFIIGNILVALPILGKGTNYSNIWFQHPESKPGRCSYLNKSIHILSCLQNILTSILKFFYDCMFLSCYVRVLEWIHTL